jgi:hypothetical protein
MYDAAFLFGRSGCPFGDSKNKMCKAGNELVGFVFILPAQEQIYETTTLIEDEQMILSRDNVTERIFRSNERCATLATKFEDVDNPNYGV